jgi:hypothetical protein
MLQKKLEKFNALSYEDKYSISMNIITNLKDRWNIQALKIFDFMQTQKKVSERLLESIYKDFEVSVENIKQKNVEDDLHKFENTSKYLDQLRVEEEKERVQEDPDSILDQI